MVLLKTAVALIRNVVINTEIETLQPNYTYFYVLSNKTVCIASIGHKGTKSNLEVAAGPQYTNCHSSFIAFLLRLLLDYSQFIFILIISAFVSGLESR